MAKIPWGDGFGIFLPLGHGEDVSHGVQEPDPVSSAGVDEFKGTGQELAPQFDIATRLVQAAKNSGACTPAGGNPDYIENC